MTSNITTLPINDHYNPSSYELDSINSLIFLNNPTKNKEEQTKSHNFLQYLYISLFITITFIIINQCLSSKKTLCYCLLLIISFISIYYSHHLIS